MADGDDENRAAAMSTRDRLALAPEALRRRCDPASLGFDTTAAVAPADGAAGQERALRAIDFAVAVAQRGYNVFATGPDGTGKRDTVEARLRAHARVRPAPPDIVFLFNFEQPARPHCAALPPGGGGRLARSMAGFVASAAAEIPRAFESESYQHRRAGAFAPLEAERQRLLDEVRSFAREHSLELEVTPAGAMMIAVIGGQRVSPEQFAQLPEEKRRELEASSHQVEERMGAVMPALREIDARARERISALDREVVLFAVGHLIDEIKREHGGVPDLAAWLDRVREDVIDNYGGFLPEVAPTHAAGPQRPPASDVFRARYEVNVFVTSESDHAPVIVERNPTFARLFGRIEFETAFGAAVTDHRRIVSGAVHRASGGYLVLRAADVLRQPFVWDKLKETLRSARAQLENPGEQLMVFPITTLTPDPVPLDLKVVLIGPADLYELMHGADEDLRELFRVRADFDVQMPWGEHEPEQYAAFVSAQVARQSLRHFTARAVALVVEEGARIAANQGKLTTQFQELSDLLTEANHWAADAGAEIVDAEHIERALRERRGRSDLVEQRLAEMVDEGTVHIELAGEAVGQLNGLAVVFVGNHAFGHPARITAATAPGGGELVSIDRESKLSGRIHDKGFLTLRGYLEQHYGNGVPLSLSASLTFEQSYGMTEGDSASSSELYALLSSLAQAPIAQGIAVTGSVDQHGRVQAVGGVTEKIEGFFAACERAGLTGEQGVVVPASNRRHLMLAEPVVASVAAGRFNVWAVATVDEGIEILTGLPAGERLEDGGYSPGSIHARVHDRLRAMAAATREWSHAGHAPVAAPAGPQDDGEPATPAP
jgi:lon-related putative ATP-dependent protease